MGRRSRKSRNRSGMTTSNNYGATGETTTSPTFDSSIFNEALIENMNEQIISQIRQQTAAEADGPFPSKFKHIARSRRR